MTSRSLTAQAVADLVGGRLLGNGATVVSSVAPLDRAGPGSLSLLASSRYLPAFRESGATAVLVSEALAGEAGRPETRIVVRDPAEAMAQAAAALYPESPPPSGIDPSARIAPESTIGPGVSVGPHAVLGRGVALGAGTRVGPGAVIADGVSVGEHCVLGPNVVLGEGARLGNRVIVKAGSVVGETGFGYLSTGDGHRRIPHIGACLIGDGVEIGANTTIDRGSIGDTVVGRETKIDNLVQIGHNCRIGERCLIMACTGIAGSVTIGDGVVIAGAVGIADHLTIGDGAVIAAKSGVFGDIPAGAIYGGYPARPHREFLRTSAAALRLPAIIKDLERLLEDHRSGATND